MARGVQPALALLLSIAAMTLIIVLRYFAASGFFAWLTGRRPAHRPGERAHVLREIGWSIASSAIYAVPAGVALWTWRQWHGTRLYAEIGTYPLWWLPSSILLYLLLHDTWFYWTHRWLHRPRPFRIAHAVHHASRPPTAWAAMCFHPLEAVMGALLIPTLTFLIPIHYAALLVVLGAMTVMGTINHMGWEIFPEGLVRGPAGNWLITASHHERHHHEYGCNYGLYFRFWDRLCGTDRGIARFGE